MAFSATVMRTLTRDQLQSRKEKAVRFTRDVLGDPDRADEIEAESLEDYADRREMKLLNGKSPCFSIPWTLSRYLRLDAQNRAAENVLRPLYKPCWRDYHGDRGTVRQASAKRTLRKAPLAPRSQNFGMRGEIPSAKTSWLLLHWRFIEVNLGIALKLPSACFTETAESKTCTLSARTSPSFQIRSRIQYRLPFQTALPGSFSDAGVLTQRGYSAFASATRVGCQIHRMAPL